MRAFLKGLLAVVLGLIAGSAVNMGLIVLSGQLLPPPPGMDLTTTEGLQVAMPLLEPRHFLFPFLAHALGTLAGALLATWIVGRTSKIPALLIGLLFGYRKFNRPFWRVWRVGSGRASAALGTDRAQIGGSCVGFRHRGATQRLSA